MSLMKFLTAGKSFDQKNSDGRYQISGKNGLPKFGSAKNPFAPKTPAGAATPKIAAPEMAAAKTAASDLVKTRKLPVLPEQLKQTKRLPAAAAPKISGEKKDFAIWQKMIGGASAAFAKLNPFAWVVREKSPARPAIPRFDKSATQTELSLDNIKVVRNDLNDADVEVVPAKVAVSHTNFKPALQPLTDKRAAQSETAQTELLVSQSGPT